MKVALALVLALVVAAHSRAVAAPLCGWENNVTADGPVIWYRLNDVGTIMLDNTANSNTGSYIGGSPAVTQGVAGALVANPDTAVLLNGVAGYMTAIPGTPATLSAPYTVEFWAKRVANARTLFSTRSGSDQSFDIQDTGGSLHGDIGSGVAWCTTAADAAVTWPNGTWGLVDYIVTSSTWTIAFNGVQVGTGSISSCAPLLYNATHTLFIGAQPGPSALYNGTMDEFQVYNKALTVADTLRHYQAGQNTLTCWTPTPTPLVTPTPTQCLPGCCAGAVPPLMSVNCVCASGTYIPGSSWVAVTPTPPP